MSTASPSRPGEGLPFSPRFLRFATALLDQQMWCWGRDVCREEGNALMQYGFERHRPPTGDGRRSTGYVLRRRGRQVALWGFGFYFGKGRSGGLFLRRYGFAPAWAPPGDLPPLPWDDEALPPFRQPAAPEEWRGVATLLPAALRWVAAYEAWASAVLGRKYRRHCVSAWHKAILPADEMARAWRRTANCCLTLLAAPPAPDPSSLTP